MLELDGIESAFIEQATDHLMIVPSRPDFNPRRVTEALEARGYSVVRR